MDGYSILIIVICQAVITFIAGLFLKNYLPSYMNEKGKNLATKEDIQEITQKTESVQQEFREKFELFSSDVQFKYNFIYKQYSELYSKLYAIIMQSEYVRRYIKLTKDEDVSFEEVPFLEVSKTHRTTQTLTFDKDTGSKWKSKTIDIETSISRFNKQQLCDYIIEKGEYASQKLLKLAVAYRFAFSRYDGNPKNIAPSVDSDTANNEEIRLIREMVCCIVSEYNLFRKNLNMEYDADEITSGIPKI